MGTMQIPIPPKELVTTINGKNETMDLLGKGEVNIIKPAGLTDVAFKFLLPNSDYPFNESMLFKSKKAKYYIDELEKLKTTKTVFQFIVVRMKPNGQMLAMTNLKCTLENYTIEEDADNGFDSYANVSLKQWKPWGAKRIEIKTDKDGVAKGSVKQDRPVDGKVVATQAKASKGQTLQQIVKKQLGNTDNLFQIAALNKIAVPAILGVGQVIQLKKEGGSEWL
jgi:hypothetical protein